VRRLSIILLLSLLFVLPITAQEAFNLPTELYVLLNEGRVDRYGLGTDGVQRVTSDEQFVIDFGVSPDGGWLAYRTPEALVVSEVLSGEGEVIQTMPPLPPSRGDGATLAWSPDARALAYTTETGLSVRFRIVEPPLEPTTVDVIESYEGSGYAELVWSAGGSYLAARSAIAPVWEVYSASRNTVEKLVELPPATDIVWLTDERIAYAPIEGGVVQLNLSVAAEPAPILPDDAVYDVLGRRGDGIIVGFSRNPDTEERVGRYTEINPNTRTFQTVGEVDIPLDGLQWTPTFNLAVTFQGGGLALISVINGQGFPLPISSAVAYDWGQPPLPAVGGYPVTANLFFVAPDDNNIEQVWQLFRDGTPPVPLTNAEANITGYALNVDGSRIAFSSDARLWIQFVNGNNTPTLLAPLQTNDPTTLDFSPDGRTLAYADSDGLWTIPVNGGDPTQVLANTVTEDTDAITRVFGTPRFAPNFGAILLDVLYAEGSSTGLLDLNSGELLELPFGYINGSWTYNGDIFTFSASSPFTPGGVQITEVTDIDNSTIILPGEVSVEHAVLIPRRTREDIRLLTNPDTLAGPTPLRVFDFRDGAGLVPVMQRGFAAYPQLSPDGTVIAGYVRTSTDNNGYPRGQLTLVGVESAVQVVLDEPREVSQVQWQR
jgi:hypothetical protein